MIKVLVTGAGGDVGQGAIRSLLKMNIPVEIFAICISEYSPWLHHPKVKSFIAPLSSSKEYIPFLIKILNKFSIDLLILSVDSEIALISKNKSYIENETNATIFVDDFKSVNICDDKFLTNKFLEENSFPFLKTNLINEISSKELSSIYKFPVIVKNRKGRGSKDIIIAYEYKDFSHLAGNKNFIIQEYINKEHKEYTAGVYIGDNNKFQYCCIFESQRRNGSSIIVKRIINKNIEKQLFKIAQKLNMKYVNIQFFYINSKVITFEFNGRLNGTIFILSKVFNIIELFINERILKKSVNIVPNEKLFVAMRYYDEIYVDPDKINDLINRSNEIFS